MQFLRNFEDYLKKFTKFKILKISQGVSKKDVHDTDCIFILLDRQTCFNLGQMLSRNV